MTEPVPANPTPADLGPVLVCVPTYNESTNIENLLRRLRTSVPDADILVLDDRSPDGTADLADAIGAELGNVEVLRRPAKAGLGNAYRAGMGIGLLRGYQVLVQIDADLSHEPEALPSLLAAVAAGADLAIGSRYVPGGSAPNWPRHRLALSRWGNRWVNVALGLPVKDATAGFRAFRADTVRRIGYTDTHADGYGVQVENAYNVWRTGGTITEVPITFRDRERGTSKMSMRIVIEAMLLVTWWGLRDRLLRRSRRRATR